MRNRKYFSSQISHLSEIRRFITFCKLGSEKNFRNSWFKICYPDQFFVLITKIMIKITILYYFNPFRSANSSLLTFSLRQTDKFCAISHINSKHSHIIFSFGIYVLKYFIYILTCWSTLSDICSDLARGCYPFGTPCMYRQRINAFLYRQRKNSFGYMYRQRKKVICTDNLKIHFVICQTTWLVHSR